jgi:hypothetical protein
VYVEERVVMSLSSRDKRYIRDTVRNGGGGDDGSGCGVIIFIVLMVSLFGGC